MSVSEMLRRPGHPTASEGWWCAYPNEMHRLIPLLVRSTAETEAFRTGHVKQVSSCRQCALRYHTELERWVEDAVASVPSKLAVARNLVVKDRNRLLPILTRRTGGLAAHTHRLRREALFELLSSVLLAKDGPLVNAVDELFDTTNPFSQDELPSVSEMKRLPGILALAVFCTGRAQQWAISMVSRMTQNPSNPPRSLHAVVDSAISSIAGATQQHGHGSDVTSMSMGLEVVIKTCGEDQSQLLSRRQCKGKLSLLGLLNCGNPYAVSVASEILRRFVRSSPGVTWKTPGSQDLHPSEVLKIVHDSYTDMEGKVDAQISLLYLYETLIENLPWQKKVVTAELMTSQLEFILLICRRPKPNGPTGSILQFANGSSSVNKVLRTGREVAGKVILHAYKLGTPIPPFRNSSMVAELINLLLRDKNMPKLAATVLAEVLLTDACNVLRSVLGPDKAKNVIQELGMRPLKILADNVLDQTIYRCACDVLEKNWLPRFTDKRPLTWMGAVWSLVIGRGSSKRFTAYTTEIEVYIGEIMLEVHRIIGLLSPAFKSQIPEERKFEQVHAAFAKVILSPLECLSVIQDGVEEFLDSHKNTKQSLWRDRLSFHCGHLLASRRRSIRTGAALFMENVLRLPSNKDRLYYISRGWRDLPELAEGVTEGTLVISRILSMLPLKHSLIEIVCHLLHYNSLMRAEFAVYFKQHETEAQLVIVDLLDNVFSYLAKVHSKDEEEIEQLMLRVLKVLKSVHKDLTSIGSVDISSKVLPWIARMDCGSKIFREAWVSAVVEVAATTTVTQGVRDLYTSVVKKSSVLSADECLKVATALSLSQSVKDELRLWKRRGTRDAPSLPVAPMRHALKFPVVKPPTVQPVQRKVPRDAAAHAEYVRKTRRERERVERIMQSATENLTGERRGKSQVAERPKRLPPLTPAERHVMIRGMGLRYKKILRLGDESAEPDLATSVPASFFSAESYVELWTPILVKEAKAGLSQAVAAEEDYYRKLPQDAKQFVRAPFALVSTSDRDEGLLQIEIRFTGHGHIKEFRSRHELDNNFQARNMQLSDVLRLELGTKPGSKDEEKDAIVAFGVVVDVDSSKKCIFTLQIPKLDNFPSCGEGVHVSASRVTSLVPELRQFEALWGINCMSERMLRTLLRPNEGWTISREDKIPNPVMDVAIRTLRDRGVLNLSQAEAVSAVVRKVGKIDPKYFATRHNFARPSHRLNPLNDGSLTLIQGPPGTGKTTTILSLLSTLLSNRDGEIHNRMRMERRAEVGAIGVAPFRILVCAPSNAAVDEIMKRVMEKGLLMPSGEYASPHVVRIGKRGSAEEGCPVEVKTLAKMDPDWTSTMSNEEAESNEKAKELKDRLRDLQLHLDALYHEQSEIRHRLSSASNAAEKEDLRAELKRVTDKISLRKDTRDELRRSIDATRTEQDRHFNERNVNNTRAIAKVLNRASIVFSTLSGSANDVMSHLIGTFDVVVVDEAAQCIEPDILIPFTGRCRKNAPGGMAARVLPNVHSPPLSRHCVLVGDPNQLPATVLSNHPFVKVACGKSLFERVADSPLSEVHLLDVQYRMHPDICHFPSTRFYDSRLVCGANVKNASYHKPYHFDARKRFGPLSFLDTASCAGTGESQSRGNSTKNDGEARIVVMALLSLFRLYPNEQLVDQIAVLSPYNAQVDILKRQIKSRPVLRDAKIEVSTVDGIQGREKSIVFLSAVRDAQNRSIGFVKDKRRMNVGLTRAQHTVVVVGNGPALSAGSDDWAAFVQHCIDQERRVMIDSLKQIFPEANARHVQPALLISGDLPEISAKWERAASPKPKLKPQGESVRAAPERRPTIVERRRGTNVPSLDVSAVFPLGPSSKTNQSGTPSPTEGFRSPVPLDPGDPGRRNSGRPQKQRVNPQVPSVKSPATHPNMLRSKKPQARSPISLSIGVASNREGQAHPTVLRSKKPQARSPGSLSIGVASNREGQAHPTVLRSKQPQARSPGSLSFEVAGNLEGQPVVGTKRKIGSSPRELKMSRRDQESSLRQADAQPVPRLRSATSSADTALMRGTASAGTSGSSASAPRVVRPRRTVQRLPSPDDVKSGSRRVVQLSGGASASRVTRAAANQPGLSRPRGQSNRTAPARTGAPPRAESPRPLRKPMQAPNRSLDPALSRSQIGERQVSNDRKHRRERSDMGPNLISREGRDTKRRRIAPLTQNPGNPDVAVVSHTRSSSGQAPWRAGLANASAIADVAIPRRHDSKSLRSSAVTEDRNLRILQQSSRNRRQEKSKDAFANTGQASSHRQPPPRSQRRGNNEGRSAPKASLDVFALGRAMNTTAESVNRARK